MALPLIGTLRKGAAKQANRPGKDLDHFRFDPSPGYGGLMPDWVALYGDQPQSIPGVRFLDDKPFMFAFEKWGGNNTLQVRHDGHVYLKRWTNNGYNYNNDPVEDHHHEDCQPVGRLAFMLPEFFVRTGVVGTFRLITTSIVDRDTIQAYLQFMRLMGAPLPSLDFTLSRVPRDFTIEINGKPSKTTKYMVQLDADAAQVRGTLQAGANAPQLGAGQERWVLKGEWIAKFYARALEMGFDESEALIALSVEEAERTGRAMLELADYTGTAEDAIRALDMYHASTVEEMAALPAATARNGNR